MKSQQETFFYNKTSKIYLDNLPVKLYTHLYLLGLINTKQISLDGPDNSQLHLTVQENNPTTLFSFSVSVDMLIGQKDGLITKRGSYTFCNKNIAHWSEVDEQGRETNAAYAFAEYAFLKEQTDACVKTIVQEIKKFKPDEKKSNEDDACQCTLF